MDVLINTQDKSGMTQDSGEIGTFPSLHSAQVH